MTSAGTASETIADFAASCDRARLSDASIRQCGRALADTLADTLAVGIAGLREPTVGRALRYVEDSTLQLDGGNSRPAFARLWGTGRTAPIETAALFNGISAHVLDFDDASSPMSGHPSVALLPALVALAEARDIEGPSLASAYVVGFEICCKVGRALDLTHYARGWHMTSSVGTIAAAAACGHLLGMDAARIVNATGLAVAQTSGTRENFGTDAKSFQAGQCNAAALRAVLLAEQGFTAAPTALDGKAGYTALYSNGEDISAALKGLGSDPLEIECSGIEVKKYPACYGIHRPLDGLFELRQTHSLTVEDIERVDIETSYGALAPLVLHVPRSGTEGKFSMEYTLAAAIADGEVRLASFTDEAVARPALRGLMGRISAREVSDQMVPRWALITVRLKNGEVLRRRIDELRGSPRYPLPDAELLTKITDCMSWSGRSIDPTSLFQAAMQLGTHRVRDILTAVERPATAISKVP